MRETVEVCVKVHRAERRRGEEGREEKKRGIGRGEIGRGGRRGGRRKGGEVGKGRIRGESESKGCHHPVPWLWAVCDRCK